MDSDVGATVAVIASSRLLRDLGGSTTISIGSGAPVGIPVVDHVGHVLARSTMNPESPLDRAVCRAQSLFGHGITPRRAARDGDRPCVLDDEHARPRTRRRQGAGQRRRGVSSHPPMKGG
jgi:hypothetical protein